MWFNLFSFYKQIERLSAFFNQYINLNRFKFLLISEEYSWGGGGCDSDPISNRIISSQVTDSFR